jgi:hypothetical protein
MRTFRGVYTVAPALIGNSRSPIVAVPVPVWTKMISSATRCLWGWILRAWRQDFVTHHQVWRAAVLVINLDDERWVRRCRHRRRTTYSRLALVNLQDKPGLRAQRLSFRSALRHPGRGACHGGSDDDAQYRRKDQMLSHFNPPFRCLRLLRAFAGRHRGSHRGPVRDSRQDDLLPVLKSAERNVSATVEVRRRYGPPTLTDPRSGFVGGFDEGRTCRKHRGSKERRERSNS